VERFPSFPQRVSHPSKDSPHQQPYRVTTAVAFLTFHSLRTPPIRLRRAVLTVDTSSSRLRRDQSVHAPRNRSCASHRPSNVVPESPAEAGFPGLVLAASEETTQPICKQTVVRYISTTGSEEPTLGMRPTVLRRVLPNMVLIFPPPQGKGSFRSAVLRLPKKPTCRTIAVSPPEGGIPTTAEPE
jgi:hypothetical protein